MYLAEFAMNDPVLFEQERVDPAVPSDEELKNLEQPAADGDTAATSDEEPYTGPFANAGERAAKKWQQAKDFANQPAGQGLKTAGQATAKAVGTGVRGVAKGAGALIGGTGGALAQFAKGVKAGWTGVNPRTGAPAAAPKTAAPANTAQPVSTPANDQANMVNRLNSELAAYKQKVDALAKDVAALKGAKAGTGVAAV